ncbi:MAG: ABC transporter ATP-binding protein [Pedosphaera sp.]|nr:ABC transporter ATP-binding protein [Pedosphaera sp.]
MPPVISARDLTKTFRGGIVAVSGLDLEIEAGVVYGLIGRNGAGKTTTLRLLMGLLRPDRGEVRILGGDLWSAPRSTRHRIAYVSQGQQVPDWMSLTDLCRYAAHFYDRWDRDIARDLANRWDLPWNHAIGRLSGGQQRLAALLTALATRPGVLLLDEPAAGLDPIARHSLNDCLIEALLRSDGCTILLSTHLIGDLERLATRVGIMDRGRIVAAGEVDDWQRTVRKAQVVFPGEFVPREFNMPGALRSETLGPVITAICRAPDDTVWDAIRTRYGARINVFPLTLEEVFVEMFRDRPTDPVNPHPGDNEGEFITISGQPGIRVDKGDTCRVGGAFQSTAPPAQRDRD